MGSNSLIAKNTLFMFLRMLVLMCITLYTSRVVLQVLGVEDFGIYNVVGSVVFIFTSISASMNAASIRYIVLSLHDDSEDRKRSTFSAVFFIHLLVGFFTFVLIECIGLYLLHSKMTIPEDRMNAAFWVFQSTAFSVIFLFVNFPYNSLIIAHEKMNVFAAFSILDAVLRLGIVYLLPCFSFDKLMLYGILVLLVQVVIQVVYVIYCRCKYSEANLKLSFDLKLWKSMTSFMGWIFLGNISYMVCTQGVNILLNSFFGPVVNAARAIAVQVQGAATRFVDSFQTAMKPQIMTSCETNNANRLKFLINFGCRTSFYLMLLLILPFAFLSNKILKLWLGSVPEHTQIFTIVLLMISTIRCFGNPLMMAIQAKGNIRKVQVADGLSLLFVLPVSYVLVFYFQMSAWTVFAANLIFEILGFVCRLCIIMPKINLRIKDFVKDVVVPVAKVSFVSLVLPLLILQDIQMDSPAKCIFLALASEVSIIVSVYFLGMKRDERVILMEKIMDRFGLKK